MGVPQAEQGATSAKALGQDPARPVGGTAEEALCLEQGEEGEGGEVKRAGWRAGSRTWAFTPREVGALEGYGQRREVTEVYICYSFIPLFPSGHIQQAPTLCLGWAGLGSAVHQRNLNLGALPSKVSSWGGGDRAEHRHSQPYVVKAGEAGDPRLRKARRWGWLPRWVGIGPGALADEWEFNTPRKEAPAHDSQLLVQCVPRGEKQESRLTASSSHGWL